MRKNTIGILATTLSLMSFTALAAEDVNIKFYGKAHVSTDYLHDGDSGGVNVSSNSSRVGVKISNELSPTLELFGQIERGVDFTEGSSTLKARDTYIGLRGDWGTVRFGYISAPTKAVVSLVEEFRDRAGEGRNILREGAANLDQRLKSSVSYQTPKWQGFQLAVHYGTTNSQGATVDNSNDVLNTSLSYSTGNWTFIGGYQHDNRDPQQTVEGSRFGLIKEGDGWRLGAVAQHVSGLTDNVSLVPTSMAAWGVSGRYQLSEQWSLRGQVFGRSYKNTDNDSVMATVGVDRIITPQLTWYVLGSTTQNSESAMANVTGGGYGDTMNIAIGNDPFALSSGLIFKF